MSSRGYDIVFPSRGRQLCDGGKNNKFERSIIADNESPDCYNVVFTNGAVETRGGSLRLNTNAVGSYAVDGLYTRHTNTGSETMIVFAGGTGYTLGTTTFTTIGSAQSVFTAGVLVGAAEMENHIFFGNGYVTPYKYNGTDFTRHGVPQATGVVSAASITTAVGVINGEARYKIAFVNSQSVVGDVGTATVTLSLTNGQVYLTSIPTAPQSHGVSARRIYRNFVSGTTSSYGLVATLGDNTTTTYVDNALDSALGASPPTDAGEPPKYSWIIQHQGRLFCNDLANPNYLWYSEINEPFTFKSTNFLTVGDGSADLIKGGAVYNNGVVVLGDRSPYFIYMPSTDPTEWAVIKIRSEMGSKSPFSPFLYNNKLMFAATQNGKFVGFAGLEGTSIDPQASRLETAVAGSDRKSDPIEPDVYTISESYLNLIAATVFKNKAYITVPYGTTQTTNNRIYIYDFSITNLKQQEASWVPVTGHAASMFTVYNGKLYYGSAAADGYVYQLEYTTFSDNGSAINSYYWTKEYAGNPGHENLQKDFRKLKLLIDKSGPYYMTVTWRVDSDAGEGTTKQVDLNPGSAIWGSFNWGASNWGGGNDQQEIVIPLGQTTGKRIQFKFSNQNTAGQKFKIHGFNFTYNLKGTR